MKNTPEMTAKIINHIKVLKAKKETESSFIKRYNIAMQIDFWREHLHRDINYLPTYVEFIPKL